MKDYCIFVLKFILIAINIRKKVEKGKEGTEKVVAVLKHRWSENGSFKIFILYGVSTFTENHFAS